MLNGGRRLLTLTAGFVVLQLVLLWYTASETLSELVPSFLLPHPDTDQCVGFDPLRPPSTDPEGCLRAKQFRQLQVFRHEAVGAGIHVGPRENRVLEQLERCALRVRRCSERPLVLSDYWYAHTHSKSHSGEAMWLHPIAESIKDLGFVWWTISIPESVSESVHMYWAPPSGAFACLSDPRCVAKADYVSPTEEKYQWDLVRLPESERGVVPAWRVFAVSFWGARPEPWNGQGMSAKLQWGRAEHEAWSFHVLGNKWEIVPYPYFGHTDIPISIERSCKAAPLPDKKGDYVLVLGKLSKYFLDEQSAISRHWPEVIAAMAALGLAVRTVANEEDGPLPPGVINSPELSKEQYAELVSGARAMLGLGMPWLSPSPYVALCRGVPVVMPFDEEAVPAGWALWHAAQHGPVNALGEPWSYPYHRSNITHLIEQLTRAATTPIPSFVPANQTLDAVRDRTREIMFFDWEGEYARVRAKGRPAYAPGMLDMCVTETQKCARPYELPRMVVD